jgi:hypothetical protein
MISDCVSACFSRAFATSLAAPRAASAAQARAVGRQGGGGCSQPSLKDTEVQFKSATKQVLAREAASGPLHRSAFRAS